MRTIIIAGGTGLIGTRLSEILTQKGHTVRILTRSPRKEGQYHWNPDQGTMDETALQGAHAIINLAGSGIADQRWTNDRKRNLVDSRVKSIQTLHTALEKSAHPLPVFVSASAIGIYGNSGEEWQTETTPIDQSADRSFMITCCDAWEKAADSVSALGIRTVKIRIGVVLAKNGGALHEIAKPLQFGLGTYFSDGKAWYSWIHLDDICNLMIWAVENEQVNGVYNGVAPAPERNYELTKDTAKAMGGPAVFLPAPAFALRLVLGEMSAVVLNSNRVSAEKVLKSGFVFQYPTLDKALAQIWA
jgi:hypothetical protein